MSDRFRVTYVTANASKIEEARLLIEDGVLADGRALKNLCEFEYREIAIKEILEVDLEALVMAEVVSAYSQIKVPCIVEHAGLIFDDHRAQSYPGGLTKPMWNALKDRFVSETHSENRKAVARAVVAYCDGESVMTFKGETEGSIAEGPRGSRAFYWDTVFIPSDPATGGKTYAEIVDDPNLGLPYKVAKLSQSAKALRDFIAYRSKAGLPALWR